MPGAKSSEPNDLANGALRRLLPAASPAASSAPSPSETGTATPGDRRTASPNPSSTFGAAADGTAPPRRKRHATTAACSACRRRKSKCNAERPQCSVCRDRGTKCEFDTNATETHTQALKRKFGELQDQNSAYQQIYDVLRSRPEHDALEIFKRIRAGADIDQVIRHVNYGDVVGQLAVVPETRYRYEFPYSIEMPASLVRPDNPYLDSEIYDFVLNPATQRRLPSPSSASSRSSPGATELLELDPYLKPFHGAAILDPWLDAVKPSRWTSVSDDDDLMRGVIQAYLIHEYDWFTCFHKDLFLQDMANERPRFCSKLLVNAILASGSSCYSKFSRRSEYWNPKNLSYQFLAEAKRLFEYESDIECPREAPDDPTWPERHQQWLVGRLTTIQAAVVFAFIYALNALDRIGFRYTIRAVEMAYEIQLFQKAPEHMDADTKRVWGFTAWSLYTWQSVNCYYYFRLPLVRTMPESLLPDPMVNPEWYSETWVRYPLSQSRLPTYHPMLFKAKADLWAIVNEYTLFTVSRFERRELLPPSEVLPFYKRLVAWLDNLPEPLTPRRMVLPHQLMLHIQYNNILIGILRPIKSMRWSVSSTEALPKHSPGEAYLRAIAHFETVMRLYYLRHGFHSGDGFLVNFLGTLGRLAMDALNANEGPVDLEHLRSTIMLSTIGLREQGRSHYVADVTFRIQLRSMGEQDVQLFKRLTSLEVEELISRPFEQPVQSDWPEYARGYNENPESLSSRVESLSLDPSTPPTPPRTMT